MPGNFKKEDLRITKTIKALRIALLTLLRSRSFARLTVHELCEEALISRATFYAHFYDKYDLLKYTLIVLLSEIINDTDKYFNGKNINQVIEDNYKQIRNIVENADAEVLELLHTFMASILEAYLKKKSYSESEISLESAEYVLLACFISGGMVNLLQLQVKNKFPPDVQITNDFLYGLLDYIIKWAASQQKQCGGLYEQRTSGR